MGLKEKINEHYLSYLNDNISREYQTLLDLRYSAANETKSTAGDKHETALAMLQIEQANVEQKLQLLREQKAIIEGIHASSINQTISQGSLVKTNKGYFYISAALGKASVDKCNVIAISKLSPLGTKLVGLGINDTVVINENEYNIEEIL